MRLATELTVYTEKNVSVFSAGIVCELPSFNYRYSKTHLFKSDKQRDTTHF